MISFSEDQMNANLNRYPSLLHLFEIVVTVLVQLFFCLLGCDDMTAYRDQEGHLMVIGIMEVDLSCVLAIMSC